MNEEKTSDKTLVQLTDDELIALATKKLITLDYDGKVIKQQFLDEIVRRWKFDSKFLFGE